MKNLQTEMWEQIRNFYSDRFGIEPRLVDIMSEINVLKLCATGASIKATAEFLDMLEEDISDILQRNFGFRGWEENLHLNPLLLYKLSGDDCTLEQFHAIVTPLETDTLRVNYMYQSAKLVVKLERILDDQWI